MKMDTSTKAVATLFEALLDKANEHRLFVNSEVGVNGTKTQLDHITYARTLVPALLAERDRLMKERDEAVDAKLDALSTLDAWFDRSELGNEAVNQAVIDAASGYLRTSRVGGMPQVESDLILGVMQDMSRIGLFADIFARAMDDLVPALLKERDEARARAAAAFETAADAVDAEWRRKIGLNCTDACATIRALATDQERVVLAKVRAEAMREAVAWFKPIEDAAGDAGLQERREGLRDAARSILARAEQIEKGEL